MKENTIGNCLIVSCAMLRDEVEYVCREYDIRLPILWIRRGMHNHPQELKKALHQVIAEHSQYDTILLTYGLCGGGICGIISEQARLVIPRFHDCIHQLLLDNSLHKEESFSGSGVEKGHYYLTRGWTIDREEIYQQSLFVLQKYGEAYGKEILCDIYNGYEEIDVVDTGAYNVDKVYEHAQKCGNLLEKKVKIVSGSTTILKKLFTGSWDEDFIVLEPGEIVDRRQFNDR